MLLDQPQRYDGWWDGRLWPDDTDLGDRTADAELLAYTGDPTTRAARLIALSPLMVAGVVQFAAPAAYRAATHGPDAMTALDDTVRSLGLLALAIGLLVTAILTAWLVRRDARTLERRGAIDTVPARWGALGGIYLAGRALSLRRQHASGRTMLMVWLLATSLTAAVIVAEYSACATTAGDRSILGVLI